MGMCNQSFLRSSNSFNKNRYLNECAQSVSDITVIMYAQNRTIGKPNNLKVWEQ